MTSMSTSFKRQLETPPARFRTPSPPKSFREPISPNFARRTPPPPDYEQITPERINGFDEELGDLLGGLKNGKLHHTSSSYTKQSSSEFLKSHHISDAARSAATFQDQSIVQHYHTDVAREEAELLLNFTREARFAVPKTAVILEASAQLRSVSFNSYIQTKPSRTALQPKHDSRKREHVRPTTQRGHKSIWKHEAYDQEESMRRTSHGSEASVGISQMPSAGTRLDSRSKIQLDLANGYIGPLASASVDESAIRSASVESKQEGLVAAKTSEMPDGLALNRDAVDNLERLSLPTTTAQSSAKPNEDIPSICALCNFARNTTENEADSDMTSWISCDGCRSWFHFACAGFKSGREVRAVDKFRCKKCKPLYGPTTYVRKSSRAHTSIDYAGLNEGVIKTSDADPEHHYVKDFKSGKKFTPENFARMRPELVTARFFELGDGMKEPVVIPAELNPRPKPIPTANIPDDAEDFETQAENDKSLHDDTGLDTWMADSFEFEMVQDEGQDALDMVIPQNLTVRKVAELYGPDEKLEVIDVKSQNGEDKPWTLQRWADYYESTGEKVVRNVISLEVSQSKLGRLIRRPKIVRDLDLQDSVWPSELQVKGEYPKVQFYCLMSVADCYTDFHIDFGGSSVYYHILRGKKTFFFIPPTEKHLKQYEEWCNSPAQNWTFLGDQTNQCYRVDLSEGDTMLIPAGWIHAVWTPADSLVIGGNFLTRLHFPLQIRVAQIEKATNVARKFRYPYFQKLLWYTAHRYMEEDPIPDTVVEKLNSGQKFSRPEVSTEDPEAWGEHSPDLEENYHARFYPRQELDGLPELCRYLLRTALIASGYITEGITTDTRNAVKRSIPKGFNHGDPYEAVKKFALWCAWKRGNETIPYWAYPGYIPEDATVEGTEKKLSTRARRKLDNEAASKAVKTTPGRQSTRPKSQTQTFLSEMMNNHLGETKAGLKRKADDHALDGKTKKPRTSSSSRSGIGRKTACEACRKSRRACKHGHSIVQDSLSDGSLLADASLLSINKPAENVVEGAITTTDDSTAQTPDGKDFKVENSEDSMVLESAPAVEKAETGTKSAQKPSGRTKACKDCRKSKRRCVHDELGNEDPRKVAEAAIPRPAAKKKKLSQGYPDALLQSDYGESYHGAAYPQEDSPQVAFKQDVHQHEAVYPHHSEQQDNSTTEYDLNSLIDPALLEQGADDTINMAIAQSAEQALSMLATSPHRDAHIDPQLMDLQVSQTIDSSLISPPDSTANGREQSPTTADRMKNLTPPRTVNGSSRHSSRAGKVATRFTPDSSTVRQPSLSSGEAASVRDSASPTMSIPPSATPLKRNKSRAQSEMEADEASLKLIREMQAQDLGLRRRA